MKDQPLKISIEKDKLVIRIGIGTLAFCAGPEGGNDLLNPEDGRKRREHKCRIVDEMEFAREVVRAMEDEEENGDTLVNMMIDEAITKSLDNGNTGCEYVKIVSKKSNKNR